MDQITTFTMTQTPIEIALGIDAEGRTTAKKLYEFLEMDKSQYARWCKNNILNNQFAEENMDYWVYDSDVENLLGGRPTQDYKLTASFAKKLSVIQKNEKGEQAREYFIQVEDKLKDFSHESATKVQLKDLLEVIPMIADDLHVNGISRLVMYKAACKDFGVPTNFLPNYVQGGDRDKKPVTDLLKGIGSDIKAVAFNKLLVADGYLEDRYRNSTGGAQKKFKAITEKGLKYGENLINPSSPKETQPYYYVDSFEELYNLVMSCESLLV